MQKPLSNPFRPAASRNLKPSSQTDGFAWSAVSETNFHHAVCYDSNFTIVSVSMDICAGINHLAALLCKDLNMPIVLQGTGTSPEGDCMPQ